MFWAIDSDRLIAASFDASRYVHLWTHVDKCADNCIFRVALIQGQNDSSQDRFACHLTPNKTVLFCWFDLHAIYLSHPMLIFSYSYYPSSSSRCDFQLKISPLPSQALPIELLLPPQPEPPLRQLQQSWQLQQQSKPYFPSSTAGSLEYAQIFMLHCNWL